LSEVLKALSETLKIKSGKRVVGTTDQARGDLLGFDELLDRAVAEGFSARIEGFQDEALEFGYLISTHARNALTVVPRSISSYDERLTREIAEELATAVLPIVSSLAYAAIARISTDVSVSWGLPHMILDEASIYYPRFATLEEALGGRWDEPYWKGLPDVAWKQWIPPSTKRVKADGLTWQDTPPLAELTLGTSAEWFDPEDPELIRDYWRSKVASIMAPLPPKQPPGEPWE
jgi:hypothetical protein